jgi:hypothetical protein
MPWNLILRGSGGEERSYGLTRIRARDVEAFVRAGRGPELAGSHVRSTS